MMDSGIGYHANANFNLSCMECSTETIRAQLLMCRTSQIKSEQSR